MVRAGKRPGTGTVDVLNRRSSWEPRTCALLIAAIAGTLATAPVRAHVPHDEIPVVAVSPTFAADQTLFSAIVGPYTWMLKSTDAGSTWKPSQTGLPYGTTTAIALSPDFASDGTLFAAITAQNEGRLFRSTDHGATWTRIEAGLPGAVILSVAVSPDFLADQTVFLGTQGSGAFKSTDGGLVFAPSSPSDSTRDFVELEVSAAFGTDGTVYAATDAGLRASIDGGGSWTNPLPGYTGPVDTLTLSPAFSSDQRIFMGISGAGVFRSDNAGASFAPKNQGLAELSVNQIAVSPAHGSDDSLLASTNEFVFQSNDGGDSWTPRINGLATLVAQTATHYLSFAYSPLFALDSTVFVAGAEGVHRSRNSAASWRQLDTFSQKLPGGLAISPDFGTDQTLFVGAYDSGIYRTQDAGETFTPIDTGLGYMYVHPLVVSPDYTLDATLFAGLQSFVARTTNAGANWTNIVPSPGYVVTRKLAISPDYAQDQTLFAADDLAGTNTVYKSTTGGSAFAPLPTPFDGAWAMEVSTSYGNDQTVFVGGGNPSGVFRSQDGGLSWQQTLGGAWVISFAVSPTFDSDGTVYAGTRYSGVWKSTDGGTTFSQSNGGFPTTISIEAMAASPDFGSDQTLLAGTWGRGVWKSTDGGTSWSAIGLDGDFVASLAISPLYASDQTLFAGGWEGAYRSTDGGDSWERVQNVRRYDDLNEYVFYEKPWLEIQCPPCSATGIQVAAQPQSRVGLFFSGESISLVGTRGPFAGIAVVFIDGAVAGQIDLYAPGLQWQQTLFTKQGLGAGEHTIVVEVTGAKNPSASGSVVLIDAFDVGY